MRNLPIVGQQRKKLNLIDKLDLQKKLELPSNTLDVAKVYRSIRASKHFQSTVPISRLNQQRCSSLYTLKNRLRINSVKQKEEKEVKIGEKISELNNLYEQYGKEAIQFVVQYLLLEQTEKVKLAKCKVLSCFLEDQKLNKDLIEFIRSVKVKNQKNKIIAKTLKIAKFSIEQTLNQKYCPVSRQQMQNKSNEIPQIKLKSEQQIYKQKIMLREHISSLNQVVQQKQRQYEQIKHKLVLAQRNVYSQDIKLSKIKNECQRLLKQREIKLDQTKSSGGKYILQACKIAQNYKHQKCKLVQLSQNLVQLSQHKDISTASEYAQLRTLPSIGAELTDQFNSIIVTYPSQSHMWIITEGIKKFKAFIQKIVQIYESQISKLIRLYEKKEEHIRMIQEEIRQFLDIDRAKRQSITNLKQLYSHVTAQIYQYFDEENQHKHKEGGQEISSVLNQIMNMGLKFSKPSRSISKKKINSMNSIKKSNHRVRFKKVDEENQFEEKENQRKSVNSMMTIDAVLEKREFQSNLKNLIEQAQQIYLVSTIFE